MEYSYGEITRLAENPNSYLHSGLSDVIKLQSLRHDFIELSKTIAYQ